MKTFRRRRLLLLSILGSLALIALIAWIALTPSGWAQSRAAFLVIDVLSGSRPPIFEALSRPPEVRPVTISASSGPIEGQLYSPRDQAPHGALILVLGYPSNINDPQLTRVAESLARLGVVVLIPRLPHLRVGKLDRQDVEVLVDSFRWLAQQPGVDPSHIGFAGFCVGSSLALVAAEDPRINDQVRAVNVFGGYYDLHTFLRAVAAQSSKYQDREYPWRPAQQTMELYVQNVLGYVDNPSDLAVIRERFTNEQDSNLTNGRLTPQGELAYALLTTTEPQAIDSLMPLIPSDKQALLSSISPSSGIDRLKTRVFIMHDFSDPFVPVTESYRLADAVADPAQKVYASFVLFEHVRPRRALDRVTLILEGIRLMRYLGLFLAEIMPEAG